jgi:hypothetical protein
MSSSCCGKSDALVFPFQSDPAETGNGWGQGFALVSQLDAARAEAGGRVIVTTGSKYPVSEGMLGRRGL